MKNLSLKERVLLIGVGLALFVAIAYIFVIMPLDKKISQRKLDLQERELQDQQYEAIKASNDTLKHDISEAEKAVSEIETSLMADVDVEVIENYVMSVFESKGSKYLSTMSSEDIVTDDIYLPGGDIANQKLKCKRISLEYATTDGFTIPEYNLDPNWSGENGIDLEVVAEYIEHMGDYEDPRFQVVGYPEFIAALKVIKEEIPSCMKIHRVSIEDPGYGFLFLRAEIDIYSASLGESRVSQTTDPNQVKLEWQGRTKVDCSGGLIGMPLICMDKNSSWYLVAISNNVLKDFQNRPAASYFSSAILAEMAKLNLPLYEDYANRLPNSVMFLPTENDMTFITIDDGEVDVTE